MGPSLVFDNRDITKLKTHCLVGTEASIGGEQNIVVKLLRFPTKTGLLGIMRAFSRRLVKLLVLFRREPCSMRDFCRCAIRRGQIRQMIDPSVAQSRFEDLAQRHDFLVHGVMRRRLATLRLALFKAMDAIFIDLASRDLWKNHAAEEWNQVAVCPCVLSARIGRTALSLRHDVEFAQVQLRSFTE